MKIEWFQYFQLASLLIAILYYKELVRFSLGVFLSILILTNITETLGVNYRSLHWKTSYPVYNLYMLLVTPLYMYAYFKIIHFKKNEAFLARILCALCLLFMFLNLFYIQGFLNFNSYSGMLTGVLHIVFCGLFLLRLITVDNEHMTLNGEPYFWITAANLLFNMVAVVLLSLQPYIRSFNLTIGQITVYRAIFPAASIILYSAFSYAFILCKTLKTR